MDRLEVVLAGLIVVPFFGMVVGAVEVVIRGKVELEFVDLHTKEFFGFVAADPFFERLCGLVVAELVVQGGGEMVKGQQSGRLGGVFFAFEDSAQFELRPILES